MSNGNKIHDIIRELSSNGRKALLVINWFWLQRPNISAQHNHPPFLLDIAHYV